MGRKPSETRMNGDIIEKKCNKCHEFKPPSEFHQKVTGSLGCQSHCKECARLLCSNWRAVNEGYMKAWGLRTKFNLTPAEYHELAKNGCMICSTYENLAVDHDHNTNEVRGILCRSCNTSLGGFKDSVELLLRAAAYLESKQGSIPEIRSSAKSE